MSQVLVILDKPRTLDYLWTDMRTITQRLGGMTMMEFLNKLAQTQPDCLHQALFVGLSNKDKKLTGKIVDDLIQGFIDKKGKLSDLVNLVLEAMEQDGLLHKEKQADEDPTART